jgi:hypothetical protein
MRATCLATSLACAAAIGAIGLAAPNGTIANLAAHGLLTVEPCAEGKARLKAEIAIDGLRALAMRAHMARA